MRVALFVLSLAVAVPALADDAAPAAPKKIRPDLVFDCKEGDSTCRVSAEAPQAVLFIPRNPQAKKDVESAGGTRLEEMLEER